MGYAPAAGHGDLNVWKFQTKVSMDQFAIIFVFINSAKLESLCTFTISHHAVVAADNTGKKSEPNDALAIFMLETFVVDQRDLLIDHGMHQFLIPGLFLFCMRKEHVRFAGDEHANWHLFYAEEKIAVAHIFLESNTRLLILLV